MSRAFVMASAIVAAASLSYLRGVPSLNLITAGAFLFAAAGGRFRPSLTTGFCLFPVYLTPALFLVFAGHNHSSYVVVWIAAVLGLICGSSVADGWSLPASWRWPLITWALTVALGWPFVAAREMDYHVATILDPRLPVAGGKISAAGSVHWIAYTAATQLIGLLWFDWLFRMYARAPRRQFLRGVVWPLAAGVLVACVVGAYQAFANLGFLSGHAWPVLNRAAGTLMDANVFGMVAAMWGPAFLVLAAYGKSPGAFALSAAALLTTWIGVWASGSRTAALVAIVGTVLSVYGLMRAAVDARPRRMLFLSMTGAAAVLAITIVTFPALTVSALDRGRYLIPRLSFTSLREVAVTLWQREGYGTASVAMIREFPFIGVGIGSYLTLSHDYALESAGLDVPPDNAQNWFRQQLAELGVIGSVGWIGWVAVFGAALWPRTVRPNGPAVGLIGPLVAFGLASLVGIPGQDPVVVMTFWTFACWFALDRGLPVLSSTTQRTRAGLLLLLLVVTTYALARIGQSDLRPPFRAVRFGFPYAYGLSIAGPGEARVRSQGVIVLEATQEWLKLTLHVPLDSEPVDVDVWKDRQHVLNERCRSGERVTRFVRVGAGRRFALETRVKPAADRWFSGSQPAVSTGISWEFISRPPT